jgi:superfamily I DNA and/or RNA helicase
MEIKAEEERKFIGRIPIIVTTCKAVQSRALKDIKFRKVVIDEATQALEIETLLTMTNADQVVLIGD